MDYPSNPSSPRPEAGLPRIDLRWDEPAVHHIINTVVCGVHECPMLATLARTAARILHAPVCAITLVDRDTVRILASCGVNIQQLDRRLSFCSECINTKEPLVVEDATLIPHFASLPLVTESGIGHYAGVPLIASDGNAIGTLCILGPGPRAITSDDLQTLTDFASTATQLLEQKRLLLEHEAQRNLSVGVLDASMHGIYSLGTVRDDRGEITDFRFTMLNAQAEQILGVTAHDVVGERLSCSLPGVKSSGLLERYIAVATTGAPFRDEIYYESETLRGWFEISAVRIHGGIAVTFANIDHRKAEQAELKLNHDRFLLVSAATEDLVWDFDLVAEKIWLSENFSRYLGYPADHDDPHINWCYDKLHPEDRERAVASFDEALRTNQTKWSAQYRMRRADGSYATMLDRAFIIRDTSGQPIRAVGACIDLTERIKAGRDIEFHRTILEAQAEATQDALLVTDAQHRLVRANRRFREFVGESIDHHAPHIAIRAVYDHAINAVHIANRVRAAIDNPGLTVKEEIEHRDGRAFELHSEPLLDAHNEFLGRVWFVRDLTGQRQSSQLLRAHNMVLEASGVVLFRWRPEPGWPVALVSRNIEQFGYTAEELLSEAFNFVQLVHPDDRDRIGAEVVSYIEAGRDFFEQEYRLICRDGSVRWIYDHTVVDRDDRGNIEFLQGVVIDITERRRVERELAENESMLKELTSQIPGAVYQYRHRPDGTAEIPYISEGVKDICGISPSQVYRDPGIIPSLILPEDRGLFEQSTQHSAQTMQPWSCEFRIQSQSGEIRWMNGNSMPRKEPDGSTIWHGLLSDITSRKLAEETLRRTTVLLERTNALALVGGWEYDTRSEALFISNEVKRILGIKPATDISLENALSFYTPESRDRLESAMQRAVESGENYDLELQIVDAQGRTRWVRAQSEAVREHGRTVKLRGALHDINDQYLAREELATRARELEVLRDAAEAANRIKSEFIANMSHEIRTPLTAILGYAELLREDQPDSDEQDERNRALDTIASAGEHLLTVINDILDISKIEAGHMKIDPAEIDLPQLVREAVSLMQHRAETKGIRLSAQLKSDVPQRIITDPTRLRQMILNLLGNAVKFTDTGSVTLTMRTADTPDRSDLLIEVEDTGPGIVEQQQKLLFSPFMQPDSSLRRRHGGSGLGLAISRRCARLMGGDVQLLRSKPGAGSSFLITLPLEEAPDTSYTDSLDIPSARSAAAPARAAALSGRILFAEDGPDNQRLISFHLRRAGAEVDVADNGRIALDMYRSARTEGRPYNLILTDIQMPELDGIELTRSLRADGVTTPIIAITAHAMTEDRDRCLQAGCDDYTTKPIDRAMLIATCHDWLSREHRARSRDQAA